MAALGYGLQDRPITHAPGAFETSAHHQDAHAIVLGIIRRGAPLLQA